MIRRAAMLLGALAMAVPTGGGLVSAQSFLGQSRPGGPQGNLPGPANPSAAPLPPVQVVPMQVVPMQGTPAPGGLPAQTVPPPQPGALPQAVPPPAATVPGAGPGAMPSAPAAAPGAAPAPNEWVAQGTAELRGVDKVTARTTALTAKVGETLRFGPLSVTVRSCVVRPPDRAPDAAGFLEITEAAGAAVFRGWMILSQPQLALVEHPTHDIRLFACRP